jgi:hypothetical protein
LRETRRGSTNASATAIIAATASQNAGVSDSLMEDVDNDANYPPLPKKKAGPQPRL